MNTEIKLGNWVKSYSKGIFRVERIIENYYDESSPLIPDNRKIGDKNKDRIIISKRLLNSKFKKSIGFERCSEHFVYNLNPECSQKLTQIITNNENIITELNNFEIPVLETIYNSDLQIDNDIDLKLVRELVEFIKEGKNFLEINNEMEKLDILRLKPNNFGNYKFQLINYDEECKNKRKIWRDAKLSKNE